MMKSKLFTLVVAVMALSTMGFGKCKPDPDPVEPVGCQSDAECNVDGKINGTCEHSTGECSFPAPVISDDVIVIDDTVISLEQDAQSRYDLPPVLVNNNYETSLQVSGGDGAYSWNLTAGALPAGLSFENDGVLLGTPTEAAYSCFTLQVVSAEQQMSREYCLKVAADIPNTLVPADSELNMILVGYAPADLNTGKPYVFRMQDGDAAPYDIVHKSGELPPGLSFRYSTDENGRYAELIGTTAGSGLYSFTMRGEDIFYSIYGDESNTHVIEREYSIEIIECIVDIHCNQDGMQNGSCVDKNCEYPLPFIRARVNTPLVADYDLSQEPVTYNLILPKALHNAEYWVELQVSQGNGIYSWSTDDELPAGMTFSEAGILSGTPVLQNPEQAEKYCFDAVVTSADMTQEDTYCVTVIPQSANHMSPNGGDLPDVRFGVNYLDPTTGEPPFIEFGFGNGADYHLELVSGALPPGLSFDIVSGEPNPIRAEISGVPTDTGVFTFTVKGYDVFYYLFGTDVSGMHNIIEREFSIEVL